MSGCHLYALVFYTDYAKPSWLSPSLRVEDSPSSQCGWFISVNGTRVEAALSAECIERTVSSHEQVRLWDISM